MVKKVSKQIGSHTLTLETGRLAKQAHGAVLVTYGDSTVLAAVCVDRRSDTGKDFLPLTVEYREKSYAIGKIPGNFFRREGRPNTKEILSARLIDRPLRPLFPKGFCNEIQIIVTVLSSDQENDQDVLGLIGSSAACALSPIPLQKIVSGVHVGYIDGQYVVNPTFQQLDESELDIVVAGTDTDILMVEGNAREVSEEIVLGAIEFAKSHIADICSLQREFAEGIAAPKMAYVVNAPTEEMIADIRSAFTGSVHEATHIAEKSKRIEAISALSDDAVAKFGEKYPDSELKLRMAFADIERTVMRDLVLNEHIRLDKRGMRDIRPITCEVSVLPRTHGSALFTRGQTQSLSVVTLGTKMDERMIDDLEGTSYKSYMLDYNFLPFSVGEVRQMRSTSRREIGHGHLAESAIAPVIPSEEVFPYTIRVVSDILESNGSSSMATVCAGSMALMDAGAPIKTAVAGIAMGLIKEGDTYVVLSDILGDEDHLGDMDFKVAGTGQGITAIQMDIKIDGIGMGIMSDALVQAHEGRAHILGIMNETIQMPRENISKYAPSILTMKIDPSKIGAVIGQGGKVIRGIQEQTGATINIDDDGTVIIAAVDMAAGQAAYDTIAGIVEDAEIGKIYKGTVKRITTFGAFVEILPGKEALIHISELDLKRVKTVEDVVKVGDVIDCKVIGIDDQGKVKCSRKATMKAPD
jgi:polyribonucleotide nucleotidyltransferase